MLPPSFPYIVADIRNDGRNVTPNFSEKATPSNGVEAPLDGGKRPVGRIRYRSMFREMEEEIRMEGVVVGGEEDVFRADGG